MNTEIARFDQEYAKSQKTKTGKIAVTKEIINEAELPLLLQDITDMANKNNVKILQLNPANKEAAAPGKKGATAAGINYSLITLELTCDYHSLSAFIGEIENAQKFMAVEELRINPQSDSIFQQDVTLIIKTYVKK